MNWEDFLQNEKRHIRKLLHVAKLKIRTAHYAAFVTLLI